MTAHSSKDAITTLARYELRARWRSVVTLGLVCGLVAGAALAAATVLWRTDTAYDRLAGATGLDDVRVAVFTATANPRQQAAVRADGERTIRQVRATAGVVESRRAAAYIGRLRGPGVTYTTITAPTSAAGSVAVPAVVAGRAADPGRADEVVVNEQLARENHLGVGGRLTIDLLTAPQYLRFSTGLGRPAGGAAAVRIVGIFRYPEPGLTYNSLVGTPAFVRAHPDVYGWWIMLRTDGSATDAALAHQVSGDQARMERRYGELQFPWVGSSTPRLSPDRDLAPTLTVLRAGLIALVVVALAAGGLVVAQLSGRLAELTRAGQHVERGLGLTRRARVAARVLAAVPAAVVAGLVGAGGALLGGLAEPIGSLARYEPDPGWLPRPAIALLGAGLAATVVITTVAITVARAGAVRRSRRALGRLPVRGRSAVRLAVALARGAGGPATSLPVRSMLVGMTLLSAAAALAAAIHLRFGGLADSPAAYGWSADFGVVDDTAAIDSAVASDRRAAGAEQVLSAPVRIDGVADTVLANGRHVVSGRVPWTTVAGRVPERAGEVAVGPRLAQRLGVGVGDRLAARERSGRPEPLRVVGVVVAPTSGAEPLGDDLLVTAAQLRRLADQAPYSMLLVRGSDAGATAALRAELGRGHELAVPTPPPAVSALSDLSDPGWILLGVLGLALAVLVVQNARLLVRRRRGQLSIAAAMGVPRRRLAGTIAVALAIVTVPALAIGAVLGWLVSRVVLAETGPRLGLELPGPGWIAVVLATAAGVLLTVLVAGAASLLARGRLLARAVPAPR